MALGKNRRILIVDDNLSIHEDFKKILISARNPVGQALSELEGRLFDLEDSQGALASTEFQDDFQFQIDSAYLGQEALAMVERAAEFGKPYALIFMDVRMPPGWDGIETIRRIWEKFPDVEVALCTAYSDYSFEEIIRNLGMTTQLMFIRKPFDSATIKQAAIALVAKWNDNRDSQENFRKLGKVLSEMSGEFDRGIRELRDLQSRLLEVNSKDLLKIAGEEIVAEMNDKMGSISTMSNRFKGIIEEFKK